MAPEERPAAETIDPLDNEVWPDPITGLPSVLLDAAKLHRDRAVATARAEGEQAEREKQDRIDEIAHEVLDIGRRWRSGEAINIGPGLTQIHLDLLALRSVARRDLVEEIAAWEAMVGADALDYAERDLKSDRTLGGECESES